MKYLRIFEGFGKERYYQEVDDEESPLLNRDKFGDYEWCDLSSRVIGLGGVIGSPWEISSGRYRDVGFITISLNTYKYGKSVCIMSFIILESSDDWIWVNEWISSGHHNQTYRCDQFEGLLELLKDKKVIIE